MPLSRSRAGQWLLHRDSDTCHRRKQGRHVSRPRGPRGARGHPPPTSQRPSAAPFPICCSSGSWLSPGKEGALVATATGASQPGHLPRAAPPRPAPPGEGWRLQALGPEGRRGQELKRRVRGKGQEEKWTRGPLTSPLATERFLPPPALLRQRPRPRIPSWRVGLSDAAGVSASSRNPGACFKVSGTERAGTELSLSCPARPDREGG